MLSCSVGVLRSGGAACSTWQHGRAGRRGLGQRTRCGAALGGRLHPQACTPASSRAKRPRDDGCRAGKVNACGGWRAAAARQAAATHLRGSWPASRLGLMQGLAGGRAPRGAGRARGACAACAGWRPRRAPRCGATRGSERRAAPRCPRTARPPAAAPPGPCAPPWPARSAAAGPWPGCARPSHVHIPVTRGAPASMCPRAPHAPHPCPKQRQSCTLRRRGCVRWSQACRVASGRALERAVVRARPEHARALSMRGRWRLPAAGARLSSTGHIVQRQVPVSVLGRRPWLGGLGASRHVRELLTE